MAWSYRIQGVDVPCDDGKVNVPTIVWGSELFGPPAAILEKHERHGLAKKASAVDIAGDFLIAALAGGPRLVPDLISEASVLGISESALKRAKKIHGGIAHKQQAGAGQSSALLWYLESTVTVCEPEKQDVTEVVTEDLSGGQDGSAVVDSDARQPVN